MLPGSLYSHFRSKAQILDLIIGPFYEQLLAEQRAGSRRAVPVRSNLKR